MRRARPRGEAGVGLIELVMAMTLSLVVLGATLSVFDGTWRRQRTADQRSEAQQAARRATAALARHLRNLSSATAYGTTAQRPEAVELAGPYDLVFRAVGDPAAAAAGNPTRLERVRYCLDGAVLRVQVQAATAYTPASPAVGACTAAPGPGWTASREIARDISNRAGGRNRPLFAYASDTGDLPAGDAGVLLRISRVKTDLFVDPDPATTRGEVRLRTSIFLRNQNRPPVPAFSVTVENPAVRSVVLDGSASEDPEAAELRYEWLDGGALVGRGITLRTTAPARGVHAYALRVIDPAGQAVTAPVQEVTFP
ncbi:MAG TPA: hypothetical protein VF533_25115 [Solirubrobacteraceae bacterium]